MKKKVKFKFEKTFIGLYFLVFFAALIFILDIIYPGIFKEFIPVVILATIFLTIIGFGFDLSDWGVKTK